MDSEERRELGKRLREYARRMDEGEMLESTGLCDDLNAAADVLEGDGEES